MKLKANLHLHTADDPVDNIGYSFEDAIDHFSSLGFELLAITCHELCKWTPKYAKYAESKNILLISGVELNIGEKREEKGKHVLVLNCTSEIEKIRTFEELRDYKKLHPEIFIIAPHPYFYGWSSLGDYLEKYIDLFDAIEHSWFYSKFFNRNKKAKEMAIKYRKPLISTSDTHFMDFININYAMIDAKEKTTESIFEAIRNNKFENITSPRKAFGEMFLPLVKMQFYKK